MADSSVNFTVRVWANAADYWGVFFDRNEYIYITFEKEGIGIPFPQMDVHVNNECKLITNTITMNNRLQLFIAGIIISTTAMAQTTPQDTTTVPKDTLWKTSGAFGFKFNQVALSNWAAGGQNSLAWNTTFDFTANYAKGQWKWDNLIHFGYGLSKQGEDPLNKTDDQILLNTSLGYELKGPWYTSLNANFRTQFTKGYNLPNDSIEISAFMAPGYLVAGLGVEFKPNKNFIFILNLVTNKTTFVLDDILSAQGAYGVDSATTVRAEFGAFLSLFYKKEIVKNVTFTTRYTMFGNYEDLAVWDVNWDLIFDFKINKFLEANLTTNLIYDQDVDIHIDKNGDGTKESVGPRVQFRQALGIGFTAKF